MERNARIFRNESRLPNALVVNLVHDMELWSRAELIDKSALISA
jgi:hypothetical protein